jgi:hypothetical protein
MIKRQDLAMMQDKPVAIANGVSITASKPFASRPSGVVINTERSVLEIPSFAGLRINPEREL